MSSARERCLWLSLSLAFAIHPAHAQTLPTYFPQGEQIPGPLCDAIPQYNGPTARRCTPEELQYWLDFVTRWRTQGRIRAGDQNGFVPPAGLEWSQSNFVQPQVMVHDRYLYDPDRQTYTVDRLLEDVDRRYGGGG